MKKNKTVYVYQNNKLLGIYKSMIDVIYDYRICYKSIEKSIKNDVSVKGYKFKLCEEETV